MPPTRHRAGLTAAVTVAVAVTGALATAISAHAAAGCTVNYTITNQWSGGFGANVTVNNLGDQINGWKLTWSFTAGQTITQLWNGTVSQSGPAVTVGNASYNAGLPTGGGTSFGFNGTSASSNPVPASFALNGVTCTGGVVTPPTTPAGTPPTTRTPTPTPTTPAPTTPAPGGTPVAQHGQLHVCGSGMCDRNNAKVQLRGVSSMWLNWESQPYAENLSALNWMRDNWHLQVIRAAMGVEPSGAYLSNPSKARGQVEQVINNAVAAGVYVIVDFHADHANNEQSQAISFFTDLARRYGSLPNVIWEDWNEPNGANTAWPAVKAYHQAVVSAIRAVDPDNIIVMGTPNWSSDVDIAASSPVAGTNLMYTLHFYSCSHGAANRAKGDAALSRGVAIFVTEWGATAADGGVNNGPICTAEAQNWINWMKTNNISWAAWKLDVGNDSSNLLSAGAPVTGGWNNYLHGDASFVAASMA